MSTLFDEESKTLCIDWRGIIALREFKGALEALVRFAAQLEEYNIIFKFDKIKEIEAEARVWFQDTFLTKNGSKSLSMSEKFALIKPSGMMSNQIVESLLERFKNTCPNLKYKQFGNTKKAINWIKSISKSNNYLTQYLAPLLPQALRFKVAV